MRCSVYSNMRCQEVGVWNKLVPRASASVYSRTSNRGAVSVLVVLTWSQAAPSDPLFHLEAIQVPPLVHSSTILEAMKVPAFSLEAINPSVLS